MPSVTQLEKFLRRVDRTFPVPLSQKQDLAAYAQKLYEKATLCAVYNGEDIVSLTAGYTDCLADGIAYIAVVATVPSEGGKGLASETVRRFIAVCREKNISAVHLYAVPSNIAAMKMYEKLGFERYEVLNEPRPNDAHLICYLKEGTV